MQWTQNPGAYAVDTDAITEAQLAEAYGIIDAYGYVWYPPESIVGVGVLPQSGLLKPYLSHAANAGKGRVKRFVVLDPDWFAYPSLSTDATWSSMAANVAWLLGQFADPDYLRSVDGYPVVGWYRSGVWKGNAPGNANTLANYNTLVAQIGPVYGVQYGVPDTAAATTLKQRALTAYDRASGAPVSPNGQHSWADRHAADQTIRGHAGFDICTSDLLVADGRPRTGEGGSSWCDPASIPDALVALTLSRAQLSQPGSSRMLHVPPSTEVDENDTIMPTPNKGRLWYDVIGWGAKGYARPSSYTYKQAARTLYFTKAGAWTRNTGVAGAYESDELVSSTAGDTLTETTANANAHLGTTRIKIYGRTGAGLGSATVSLNGTPVGTASNAGSTATEVVLFDSGVLAASTYQVTLTVLAGGTFNVSSIERTFAP